MKALAWTPCCPRRRRVVPAGRGGGGVSAGGGGSGRRSAVSRLRSSGPPLALVAPVLSPTGGGARLSVALYRGGGVGQGARLRRGGRPAALSPSHLLAPIALADGARPSPASLLVWGLGLRRWRVPPAVAPVREGVAQSPGEPVVGVRIRDAEHRPPPSRKAGHDGSLSGHAAQITSRRTLSWTSGAAHPPGGIPRFPPSLRRSTASKSWFLIPQDP